MNCPNCNAYNKPGSQFCIQCGEPLQSSGSPPVQYRSAKEVLGIYTARMVIALIGLMILNMILTGLSFIEEINIPDFDMSAPTLITILIYLVAIGLLIHYGVNLRVLWPRAFPKFNQAHSLFNAVIYVVVLSMTYKVIKPFILEFSDDYSTPLLIIQLILVAIVLVILGTASIFIYQVLPIWIASFKESIAQPPVQFKVKEEQKRASILEDEEE